MKKTNLQTGQTLMLTVIFFVLASVTVLASIVGPVVRTSRNTNQLAVATHDYFVTEAGTEDVLYRLRTGKAVSTSETLDLDGSQAVTTVTDISGGKIVTTVGTENGATRKVESRVIAGQGASFSYGIQTGNGGFNMSNNAQVIGNVYSNGPISGSNGATITGSAFSANSAALTADQANSTPLPPTYDLTFGNANGTQDVAQSFQVTGSAPINKVRLYLKKVSTPSNLTVRVVADNAGAPGTNTVAQGTLSASLVTAFYSWIDIPFSSNPVLTPNTTYWLVLDGVTNSSRYYLWGANTSYGSGGGKIGQYSSSWSNTSPSGLDGYFEFYLGGLTGSISNVTIGSGGVGDARAHTVTGSSIAGNLYCQTGGSNNKSCNTSQPDPTPQGFPVSDANVLDWKTQAEAGGTISGNYSPGGSSATLGPKKITGDLTISNGFTLTVSGTLWVQGNINISNNAAVKLSSGYGSNSGVVVSDGRITLSNGAQFSGSGQTGSYVLLLTTSNCGGSNCGGSNAIEVSNNAGAVILNAQNGTIHFSNNAGAKEATAGTLSMDNGATITYDTGLANINFVSGPSGGWSISGWKEIP